MSHFEISKVILTPGNKEIALTIDEAHKIYLELNRIFGSISNGGLGTRIDNPGPKMISGTGH